MLLDLGMPGMDGLEVARRVRSGPRGEEIALVALTGWDQDKDRRRSAEAGFDQHMVKPLDLARLQTILASLNGNGRKGKRSSRLVGDAGMQWDRRV